MVVLGDINDFEFSETVDILVGGGVLVDLPRTLPDRAALHATSSRATRRCSTTS